MNLGATLDVKRDKTVIDTAKRRHAGKIPKWRVEDFQSIVSKNADAMIVLDHAGYILYANPAALSLFSLPSAEMVGAYFGFPILIEEPVEIYLLREFKDFVAAEMRIVEVVWAGEPSYLLSFRDLTDRIMAEQALSQSRDDLDVKVNVRTHELSETNVALKREITERKRAEETLRETRDYLESLINYANAPIIVWDSNFAITQFNHAFERLSGYASGEVVGKNLKMLFPSDSTVKSLEKIRSTLTGEHWESVEIPILRKDDSVRIALWNSANIKGENGEIQATIAQGQDITERKRAEDELKEQSILLNLGPDGIITRNLDGKIDFWSKGAEALYGWKEQEAIGQVTHSLLKTVFPCTVEDINRALQQTGGWSGELAHTTKDGRQIIVQSRWLARHDDKGNIKNILESNVNITERKQAEVALEEAKAQAELYLDLMGHDINNMHQIALGYLELARDMPPGARGSEFLDKPIEVLQRSARLIQNVRKLQRLREGVFRSQEVDICQVLVDLQREFGAVPHKAITLNMNGYERCHVRANELLHDVFANLLSNAIMHTGDRADIDIGLGIVNNDGLRYCRVSVEDDGPGIPNDLKVRIFSRGLKGTSKAKGMGLGLFLVKSLVDSYGGKVWVEDRVPGDHTRGAKFVVVMPAAEQ
jgi:PAS domain S-box-containing protein